MDRAPWYVAAALGVSLAVVILLAGPLLLFNPAFRPPSSSATPLPTRSASPRGRSIA